MATLDAPDHLRPAAQTALARQIGGVFAQPVAHRHRKAGLPARGDGVGERVGHRVRQLRLGWRVAAGQQGGERADHGDIGKRHADLDTMGHAGPVGIAQQLVAHIPVEFERGHDAALAREPARSALEALEWAQRPHGDAGTLAAHQPRQFPRHVKRPAQQVGASVGAAVFEQPGIFGRSDPAQHRARQGAQHAAQARQARNPVLHARHVAKTRVATEQFVATEARYRHLEAAHGGGLRHQIAVDAIGRRLVHGRKKARPFTKKITALDPARGVLDAEACGGLPGENRLVVNAALILAEPERNGAQASRVLFGPECS